ncbi:MAG: hypothetical protein HY303_15115 [Candidatus Wallbacteria bacterium]|nr:hypothetical protein [Candidatus Wallbacteria bacterium]
MDTQTLIASSPGELTEYLWTRFRQVEPTDPPLGHRFGDEPPALFVIQTVRDSNDPGFRRRVVNAARRNLSRLALQLVAAGENKPSSEEDDNQLASLAYFASEIGARELSDALYQFASAWKLERAGFALAATAGLAHVVRTLVRLQSSGRYAPFWRDLWEDGPVGLAGLAFHGWFRADPDDALEHLGQLVERAGSLDLPGVFWTIVSEDYPGEIEVFRAAAACDEDQRRRLRLALVQADAGAATLRDFDLQGNPPALDDGGFPWSTDVPKSRSEAPRWGG